MNAWRLARSAALSALALVATPVPHPSIADTAPPRWVVLVYACGDAADPRLESSEALFAREFRSELAKSGLKDTVVGVVFDRIQGFDDDGVPGIPTNWTEAKRMLMRADGTFVDQGRLPLAGDMSTTDASMGDPATLEAFARLGIRDGAKAGDALALVICGHGTGYAVCQDETNDRDALSLSEIRDALICGLPVAEDGSSRRIALLAYYSCHMATLEAALSASSRADYLLACQEEVDAVHGWDCSALGSLDQRPTVEDFVAGKPASLGGVGHPGFAAAYHDVAYASKLKTISLTHLADKSFQRLHVAVEAFAQAALAALDGPDAKVVGAALVGAATNARGFIRTPACDLRSLTSEIVARLGEPGVPESTAHPLQAAAAAISSALAQTTRAWNGSDVTWATACRSCVRAHSPCTSRCWTVSRHRPSGLSSPPICPTR